MKIAFVVYDGMTALDLVGFFDPVTRLKTMGFKQDLEWDLCARREAVTAVGGLQICATKFGQPLGGYDMVFVPGGFETRALLDNRDFLDWIATARGSALRVSVCSGALLLGAAGLLEGKTATSHPRVLDILKRYAHVSTERIVDDGDVVTAGGVTAAIDLGLYMCERIAGKEVRDRIQEQMDYKS